MKRIVSTFALATIFLGLVPNQYGETKRLTDQERQAVIDASVKQWQTLYGNVNFSDMWLFNLMAYINPQNEKQYKPVSMAKLAVEIKSSHESFAELIFQGELQKKYWKVTKQKFILERNWMKKIFCVFLLS